MNLFQFIFYNFNLLPKFYSNYSYVTINIIFSFNLFDDEAKSHFQILLKIFK